MINSELLDEYELEVEPVRFTLSQIPPERRDEVERMMRDAIAGKRGPVTDAELGLSIPEDAES